MHSLSLEAQPRPRTTSTASVVTGEALDLISDSPSSLVWRLTFTASILGFLFGYDTGYISSVLVSIGSDLGNAPLTIKQSEYISSATSFGALITSFLAGLLVDLIGRKYTVIICDLLFIIGVSLQFTAHSVFQMIIGRLIMGFGIGIGSLAAPLYISELSPGKFRGRLVTMNCLAITGGQLIAYSIGAIMSNWYNGWRYIVLISLIPCLIQLWLIFLLPDTPRYLIMKQRYDDAFKVLKKIYPLASDSLLNANIDELQLMNKVWLDDDTLIYKIKSTFNELFKIPSNRRSLIIACGLQATQQFIGFNALMYFSSSIFQMVGFQNSTFVSCFIAGTNFIVTILAIFIIDSVGRRKMLLYSMPALCLSQIVCAISFNSLNSSNEEIWKYILLISLMSFVAFYSIGLGNIPWQQSELFTQKLRGVGSSLSTATNWFGSMIISFCFLSLMESISPSLTFLVFAFNTLISFIFIYFTYPELTGLQLEQVQDLLKDGFNVAESMAIYDEYRQIH